MWFKNKSVRTSGSCMRPNVYNFFVIIKYCFGGWTFWLPILQNTLRLSLWNLKYCNDKQMTIVHNVCSLEVHSLSCIVIMLEGKGKIKFASSAFMMFDILNTRTGSWNLSSSFQEDLLPQDIDQILDELKAGTMPPPGPRYMKCQSGAFGTAFSANTILKCCWNVS